MLGGMNVAGIPYRTIWPAPAGSAVSIVDQTLLPHRFATIRPSVLPAFGHAIRGLRSLFPDLAPPPPPTPNTPDLPP